MSLFFYKNILLTAIFLIFFIENYTFYFEIISREIIFNIFDFYCALIFFSLLLLILSIFANVPRETSLNIIMFIFLYKI